MRPLLDSIANRVFLILLAGIVVATVTTTWLAANERQNTVRELRYQRVAERVEQIVGALDDAAPGARQIVLDAARDFGFDARLGNTPLAAGHSNPDLVGALKTQLGDDRRIIESRDVKCVDGWPQPPSPRDAGRHPPDADPAGNAESCRLIYVSLRDGELLTLNLKTPRDRAPRQRPPQHSAIGGPYMLLFLALIALLAYAVARMTARPIKQLAAAAGELGQDIDQPPLPEKGPLEIRQAAGAFNLMQARIRRQIQHRTHMLAAITHDLQTPLTRLRLRLEKVGDDELRGKLVNDLAQMQQMVQEGLDLARSMDSSEAMQRLDIDSLLDSVCADASDAGLAVTQSGRAQASILAQPNALRRCLTNLLDNAIKYGHSAEVSTAVENGKVAIRIRDHGAGIPEDQLDAVFEPFFRLETSRSRDTGGTGLGLTIARNIAENHGATLRLDNCPDGGLQVTLLLPIRR
ncbi:HAMP domain-containing protein [Oxalobacteraceae bacterium CAVE-383]|nr:HAMP domain-containing protein [Oxalobacteraceae bacterium CAVE-383]